MTASTEISFFQQTFLDIDPVSRRQGDPIRIGPITSWINKTTVAREPGQSPIKQSAKSEIPDRTYTAPVASAVVARVISADSTPLQIWEGTVIDVDRGAGSMHVLLEAKIGQVPRHTAEIDLEWVSDQDQDLVCPGAVFYLTLFKRTKPSVENAQELRFRRRPSWSVSQLKQIDEAAGLLLSKMKVLPSAA